MIFARECTKRRENFRASYHLGTATAGTLTPSCRTAHPPLPSITCGLCHHLVWHCGTSHNIHISSISIWGDNIKIQRFESKVQQRMLYNFRLRRWGSSLLGLRTPDPPLSPPLMWAEIFRHPCLQSQAEEAFHWRSFSEEVSLNKFRWRSFADWVSLKKFRWRSFAEEMLLIKFRWRTFAD